MAIMNKLQILEEKQFYAGDTERFNMFFSFVTTFVIKLYGENYILDKVKANPGSTIWDYVTSSDVSYGITQVVNGMDRWKQEYEIRQMPKEEQDKYKKEEVRKKLPQDEQEKYVRFQGKFTTRAGRKSAFLSCGYNKEGLRMYKMLWKYWKDMFRDKDWFDMMLVAWEVWVEENEFGEEYKEKKRGVSRPALDDSEDEDEDEFADLYVMPSDERYVSDRPWATTSNRDRDSANDSVEESDDDDDDDMNHDGGTPKAMSIKQVKAICRKSRNQEYNSDSSSDEEEVEMPRKKKKKVPRALKKPRVSKSPV